MAKQVQVTLATPNFRVYTATDVIGAELCGALKNVLAIACGASDGFGFGANARAALITRGAEVFGREGWEGWSRCGGFAPMEDVEVSSNWKII